MVHKGINPNSEEITQKTARAMIEYILAHPTMKKKQLTAIKGRIGKQYGFVNVIKDSIIASYATEEELKQISFLLRRRLTRTLSGVTIVAVMTAPTPEGSKSCPGECIFCPGPDSQPGEKVAQSYTGREPAAMRSAMYHYDGYEQTLHRLIDLAAIGHEVDKIELIVMGGTFLYFPQSYQNEFIQGCYDAILNFREPDYNSNLRSPDLATAKVRLESSQTRLIGVTFETRPDYALEEHVDRILELGATRIEIGVQTTRDDILTYVHRNHTVADNIKAIRICKDAGLKVNAHMMPNLPLSSPETDVEIFRELFNNPLFRPDMLKIYPCLVIEGTQLYELYQSGEYHPYSQEKIVEVIAQIKSELPRYVRIQRIQRDIPVNLIVDGVKNSNLRQIVQAKMKAEETICNCIRCREEGFYAHKRNATQEAVNLDSVKFYDLPYVASEGEEHFLSFEDIGENMLIGYLRLRIPSSHAHRSEVISKRSAIVREIRVVGELVGHNSDPKVGQIQHRGYGKRLMEEAEKIARAHGCKKILVIAGIGVRPYFYKQGYTLDGPYVSKNL